MNEKYSSEVSDVIMTMAKIVKARELAAEAPPANGELAALAHILSVDISLMKVLNYGLMLEMDPGTRADFQKWRVWIDADCTAVTERMNLLEWQAMRQDLMLERARSTVH
jgi:hypothetical protein